MEDIVCTVGNTAEVTTSERERLKNRPYQLGHLATHDPEDVISIDDPHLAVDDGDGSRDLFLSEKELQFLDSLESAIRDLGQTAQSSRAVSLLREFAGEFAIGAATKDKTKWAAFLEEDDGSKASLILYCAPLKRQVSFEFDSTSDRISIIKIGSDMSRTTVECQSSHANTLWNAIAWLLNPA